MGEVKLYDDIVELLNGNLNFVERDSEQLTRLTFPNLSYEKYKTQYSEIKKFQDEVYCDVKSLENNELSTFQLISSMQESYIDEDVSYSITIDIRKKDIPVDSEKYDNYYIFTSIDSAFDSLIKIKLENKPIIFIIGSLDIEKDYEFMYVKFVNSMQEINEYMFKFVPKSDKPFQELLNQQKNIEINYNSNVISITQLPIFWSFVQELPIKLVTLSFVKKIYSIFLKLLGSNSSDGEKIEIVSNKLITINLRGIQKLSETSKNEYLSNIFEISKQLFNDYNKFLDKSYILKNIIVNGFGRTVNIEEIITSSAIVKNKFFEEYRIYINNEMETFLDQKNKLYLETIETVKKINDLTKNLFDTLRIMITTIMGTYIATFLPYFFNENSSINLFRVLVILSIIYLFISLFVFTILIIQKNDIVSSFERYIESLPLKQFNYKTIKEQYMKVSIYLFNIFSTLIILLICFVLIFIICNFNLIIEYVTIIKKS